MDSSSNIYQKNRISYINSQLKNNYNTSSKFYISKTKDTCYLIVGLLAMYVGFYMIISSVKNIK